MLKRLARITPHQTGKVLAPTFLWLGVFYVAGFTLISLGAKGAGLGASLGIAIVILVIFPSWGTSPLLYSPGSTTGPHGGSGALSSCWRTSLRINADRPVATWRAPPHEPRPQWSYPPPC